jgi:type III pantothenate kinase
MMQGLVTIDFGNSHPHAGLFQKIQNTWSLIKVVPWTELSLFLNQLQMTAENSTMVLCEVKAREEALTPLLQQGYLITRVKDYWRGQRFAGMPVNYAHSLGEDRLIQAFFVYKNFKKRSLLIDAGTFTTMDVITNRGFEGGYIFPQLENYLSTFQKGDLLKNVPIGLNISSVLPQGTAEAMRDSYFAFAALAQKIVLEHQIDQIIVTGGQSALWKQVFELLKLNATVQEESHLIHLALQFWMTTQIETL